MLMLYWIVWNRTVIVPDIGLGVRVFANGPGDLGSIPGRVIPKTQKMVLDASLLNTQHYKVRIKGKVEQSREGVAPSPTPWCSSYRKGSLRVTLDYGRQLYFTLFIKIDLALNNLQWMKCHKTKPNPKPPLYILTWRVVSIKILFMGQICLFKKYSYLNLTKKNL